jgi:hypothetical protein
MIVLDENIPEDQCQMLRRWRIRFSQVGRGVGRPGMKDEQHVLPLLHKLNRPTFLTRDLGFFDEKRRHGNYALVCLAVSQKEAAVFIRQFLRHPAFNTKAKRLGAVVLVSQSGLRVWHLDADDEESLSWPE